MKNLFILSSMFWLLSCANLDNVYDDTYDAALKPVELKNNDESGYSDYIKNSQDGYAVVEESQENKLFNFGNTNQNYTDVRYTDRDCDCMNDISNGVGNRPYWNSGPYSNYPNYNYYLTSNNFSHLNCYGGNSNYLGWASFGYGWNSPYAGPNSYWYNNPWDLYGGYSPYGSFYPYGYNPYGYYGNGYNNGFYNNGYYNNINNNNSGNNGVVASGNAGRQIYGHRGSTNAISSNTTSYEHTVKGVSTNISNGTISSGTSENQPSSVSNENSRPIYVAESNVDAIQNTSIGKPAFNQFSGSSTIQGVERTNGAVAPGTGQQAISSSEPYQNSYARYTIPSNSGNATYVTNSSSTSRNSSTNSTYNNSGNRVNSNGNSNTFSGQRTTTSGNSGSTSGGSSGTTRTTSSSRR